MEHGRARGWEGGGVAGTVWAMANVAEYFVETLTGAGVERMWGLAGDSLNALTDALRRDGRIEWLHMRHEEAAAFAAGADAELTGDLAVVAIKLLGCSAMAGAVGGGGLGELAVKYGYNRFQTDVMAYSVLALVAVVQVIQGVGTAIYRRMR